MRCIELVHEELDRLIHVCASQARGRPDPHASCGQELSQFRNLKEQVIAVVSGLLRGRMNPTTTMVANLIAIEVRR